MGSNDGAIQFEWVEEGLGDTFPSFSGGTKRKLRRKKKKKFIGWASKPLVHFLQSIGKMTNDPLSQHDLTSIVNQYISQNNLINPSRKKRVISDDKLYALFGRKTFSRLKIFDLLDSHLAQNQDDSDDSAMYTSDDDQENFPVNEPNQTSTSPDPEGNQSKQSVCQAPGSCFAAVTRENIKLLYLKRSLVETLLLNDQEETFEQKLIGSFVRVKSDPFDFHQKNSHQLQLVMGVKKVAAIGNGTSDVLLEIADMAKHVKISELSNDVFSEEECKDLGLKIKDGILEPLKVVDLQQKAELLHADITKHWLVREIDQLLKLIDRANEKGWRREMFEYRERRKLLQNPSEQARLLQEVPRVIAEEVRPDIVPGNDQLQLEEEAGNLQNSIQVSEPRLDLETSAQPMKVRAETGATKSNEQHVAIDLADECTVEPSRVLSIKTAEKPVVIDLVDDDTEDEDDNKQTPGISINDKVWHYMDPQYSVQGPFSIGSLEKWYNCGYFPEGFAVWKTGQSPNEAVLLKDLLLRMCFLD